MAALQSTLENGKGNIVSSTSNKIARVMAATWDVAITTILTPDGEYTIVVKDRKTDEVLHEISGSYTGEQAVERRATENALERTRPERIQL